MAGGRIDMGMAPFIPERSPGPGPSGSQAWVPPREGVSPARVGEAKS